MDKLAAMEAFRAVVEEGGFTAAAARRRISKSAISKMVKDLEAELGVALLNRTTRRIALTEVGERYYERCQRILAEVEEADSEATALTVNPRGTLRVNAALSFSTAHVAPLLPAFLERYPDVRLELTLADRFVDLVEEGVDVAIRIGRLADSSLIARKLGETRRMVCGAPAYFDRYGEPTHPNDLGAHNCLRYTLLDTGSEWCFRKDGRAFSVPVTGTLEINNGDALRTAAVGGLGLCCAPAFTVYRDLAEGRLRTVLDEYECPPLGIYAVYPPSRHLSAKVRAFVDFLADHFSSGTPWD
ncbi:MAG: LysR family transcriptional regulator [Alphaproteobacteria bacterium]|nr:MAG: LysR family transcriptional regulator [Alphaproteobacteria bacterium]